jgi:hypothetical protein
MAIDRLLRGQLFGCGVLLAALPAVASDLDGLLQNSPFGAPPGDARPANAAAEPLELRGVFVDQGETFISVYDNTSHAGRWVGLNEEGSTFVVRSFDPVKGVARVSYQGRELTLALKQAKIVAAAVPAAPAPAAVPASPGPGQPVVAGATPSTEEAVRLAAIAEEIRRRRALRQQALAVPPPPAPNQKP